MTINAITADRIFSVPGLIGDQSVARTTVALSLAIAILVDVPASIAETSGDSRQYFLENAKALQPALDDIREIFRFNSDSVLANAYSIWEKRYNVFHGFDGNKALHMGTLYSQALTGIVPGEFSVKDLQITGDFINEVTGLIRQSIGLDKSTGE